MLEACPHPDADKLRVCRVATRDGEKQIVCGAPNARAGIKVVVAAPGDYIPGIDTTIKVGKIRGVESHGMMLSEREMELSDEHTGIVELAPDAPVGARYIDVAPFDPVIEIAVTPNRPDALGVAGIARDLAARGLGRLITPEIEPVPGAFPYPVAIYLAPDVAGEACPLFVGRLIRGVQNGPSPQWLQDRLRAIGLRPISALVDITNFVTYDRNRPLHVFDAAKVHGPITVRLARPGEKLTALDGKDYAFDGSETLVCDANGPEAIGGVMGGLRTGVTEATTDVFVEAAYFDPVRTARTGRRLRINSDARYRFERGVDPAFTPAGIELATRLILDLCGGEPSEVEIAGAVPNTDAPLPPRPGPGRPPRRHGHPRRRADPHPDRARLRRRRRQRRAPDLAPRRPGRGRPRRGDRPRRLARRPEGRAAHPPRRRREADPDPDAAPRGRRPAAASPPSASTSA